MDSHMADELVVPLKFPEDSVHFLSLLILMSLDVLLSTRVRVSRKTTKPRRYSVPGQAPSTHVLGSHKTWGSQLKRYQR
ncbi:hypothetical protein Taro_045365 [Colocasia esculenta]|uniref:Uncharacterized protein n=1 Tax=Colocasia esculenta TaxID=4460 RepID=A0A843X036_COLES|nr:hypothetical protein [Colocasia esculenta]